MLLKRITKLADERESDSLSVQLRKKRFGLFTSLMASVPTPINLIDVGGTVGIWEREWFSQGQTSEINILILNQKKIQTTHPQVKSMVGDATNMQEFQDREFDVVFSNSVIEHVGDYEAQRRMANEVCRIGKRYFLQTPNRYFPIEPHLLFPFFQFLPLAIQVWLVMNFDLGWCKKIADKQEAISFVQSIQLLSKQELTDLFPNAKLFEEKVFGFTKSFIVYDGWENLDETTKL
ncbi:MAG: class I SAM-dependent methyltransferase [Scytolyngbya sp. HA4215-MV1]|jgi:ubiquinone/menaquinone biosynthesis C-methylase UbiE|nr:class I SAM-dependent methyltransferase [Scytolyngbya sp. HA4215-MV1]